MWYGTAVIQLRIEPLVPAAYGNKQRDCCKNGHAQREDDLPEDSKIVCAVDARGFRQRLGKADDIGADNDHVEAGKHSGNNVDPECFAEIQRFLYQQEIRNQAGVYVHGHNDDERDGLS